MAQAAPLPGIIILTTTPPLYLPSLLLSSHIRHPLKDVYPKLVAEHWSSYLADLSIEADASQAVPVVWLKGVPDFSDRAQSAQGDGESESGSDGESEIESDSNCPGADRDDGDGNIWRSAHQRDLQQENQTKDWQLDRAEGTAFANLTVGQVTYLSPVPAGGNPMLSLAFLAHFHSVLSKYFQVASISSSSLTSTYLPVSIPASVLSANFDVVYQILQEMLDDGRPLTTELSSIKEIVRGKAWWENIMGKMNSLASTAPVAPPQMSALPWRSAVLRYSRNEVFVDIVEVISGVMDRKGKAVAADGLQLTVSIGCKTKLSGTPDLSLALYPLPKSATARILAPSFHPCVRHERWLKDGVMSFVPPDGEFELAQFNIGPPGSHSAIHDSKPLKNTTETGAWERWLPFILEATRQAPENDSTEWTFEIRLTSSSLSKTALQSKPTTAEGIEVSFTVGPSQLASIGASAARTPPEASSVVVDARVAVSSLNSLSSGGEGFMGVPFAGSSANGSTMSDDAGSWHYDAREGVVRWTVPQLGSAPSNGGRSGPLEVTLKGKVFASGSDGIAMLSDDDTKIRRDDLHPKPAVPGEDGSSARAPLPGPSALLCTFSLPAGTPSLSGLKVASLTVGGRGIDYKPFKGVRGATRGHIEWRW